MLNIEISHLDVVKHLIHNSKNINLSEQGQTPDDLAEAAGDQYTLNVLRSLDSQNKEFFLNLEDKMAIIKAKDIKEIINLLPASSFKIEMRILYVKKMEEENSVT